MHRSMEDAASGQPCRYMARSSAAAPVVLILIASLGGLWAFGASSAECPATNECVGPEVGEYTYTIANGGGVILSGAPEAETIAAYTQLVTDTYQPCTFNFNDALPPALPIQEGYGNAVSGPVADYYAAMGGNGTYGSVVWNLSTEISALRIPLVYSGTYGSGDCSRTFRFGAYLQRSREVRCPGFGAPGGYKIGGNGAFCWRALAARNPIKNLGERSTICANPVNGATGSKFQAETDYRSPNGSGGLSFTRYYDSRLIEFYSTGSPYGVKSSLGPNWRSTYERRIDFSASLLFPTAHVYRPDGQTLFFHFVNNQFVPDADIADRLVRLNDSSGNLLNWQYTVAGTEDIETYDASGKLISIRSRAGVMQILDYNASGDKLESVEDSFGKRLEFAYDGSGRLASMTTSGGGTFLYAYTAQNNVSSVTYPDGRSRTYLYNEQQNTGSRNFPWALTGIVDEANGRFSTYKYDGNRRAYSSEHAGGANKYVFTYPGTFEIGQVTITDPLLLNRTVAFKTIHGAAKISAISQPCATCGSSASATSYDVNGNASSRTDFNGNVTTYAYDLTRNLETSRTEAFNTPRARTITMQWHATYRLPTQIDEPGKRTTFTHDANGNVLTRTELDTGTSTSRTWTYTYNSFGQVLTLDGPRTDVLDITTYTYYTCTTGYQCGQVHTITNAAGHVATYDTYNAHGQPLTMTDPNGVVTTLTYDLRQRLTSRTVGTEVTAFDYWPTGLLKKATLPDASYLEYTYDAAHRLTEIEDSEGNRIVYTLDAMGNRTAEQLYDPSSTLTQTRTRVFNTLNRLWKEIGAAGTTNVTTTFGYDTNGNQTSIAAPLGRNSGQGYDELNRLTQVTDPLSGVTQYGYNALDQLISVTDPRSKVTSYTYNALGDLTEQVSPDTGTTSNTYDAGGNLLTSTDARSKTATYGYDALNRVTSLSYPDQSISYTYDDGPNQKGRLTQVTDASGSTSWTYDPQGRVLSRQQSMGITKSVGYAYDASGRLQTLTLPSGNTVTYGYTDNKVTSLTLNGSTTILSNVLYQPFGPTRGWTWGNGTLAIREYDTDGLVTDIDSAGLKTYDYDDAFRITDIADAGDPTLSQSYGYDLLDRLTAATATSLNQSWTYDANGNRLTQGGSQVSTYTVSGTSNRLTSVSGSLTRSYSYDNAGNTTNDGAATFLYNDAGRMVSATKAGTMTTYALNALGQRVKKTSGGSSRYFVYDEAGHLLGEYDNSGVLIQETLWFGDTPIATIRPNGGGVTLFYVHSDHLNTPRRITRPSDNVVVWRWDSDPFGTTAANEDPDGDSAALMYNLRFAGQYSDQESGLSYNYYRDGYDPATGRYTQSDPVGLSGGVNTYMYVLLNPVSLIDPFGLTALDFDVASGRLRVDPEVAGQKPYEIDATSGRGQCENKAECEKRENEGPIPRGSYYIDPNQIDNPPFLDDLRRNFRTPRSRGGGDWGDWRVRIYPNPGTQRFGRTGFYLHGGYFDGSAGCIDIGGGVFGDDRLLNDLLRDPDGRIPLRVR